MLYFQSEFIEKPIIARDDTKALARVQSIIIDHENGKILGVHAGKNVIAFQDILTWKPKIEIMNGSVQMLPEDIVRIQKVLDSGIKIMGNTVKTEKNQYIGKVVDCIIDIQKGILSSLYVAKNAILFPYDKRIIPATQIVEIRKDAIIVCEQILMKKIMLKDLITRAGKLRSADTCLGNL
ncbi:PRC-barrel domain-containing protein [Candidatus Peregrinibacteria bacterium]|nr:PRC-barrel domain-containing protein [Candidatus Peregrinibacteria bacterium]